MKALKLIVPLFLIIIVVGVSYLFAASRVSGVDDGSSVTMAQPQAYAGDSQNAEIEQAEDNLLAGDYPLGYNTDSQPNLIVPGDPDIDKQWALISLQISELWQITTGSQEVLIAILDTGVDGDHEDLSGQIEGEVNFTDSPIADDIYGHGTHIAGIIAAEDNDIGIVGIAPGCRLLNVKVADDRGRCDVLDLAEGIVWAVDNGADVINISIEIKESSPDLEEAVQYAWDHGALIIAAAGNSGSQNPVYPAYYENCIAVAAVAEDNSLAPLSNRGGWIEEDNSLAPLSNRGGWIDLVAPGFQIYSTLPDDSYDYESGTSFAAAHVSGIAALLFSVAADTNGNGRINDEVKAMIEAGCQDIGITGTGKGCIDAAEISVQINQPL